MSVSPYPSSQGKSRGSEDLPRSQMVLLGLLMITFFSSLYLGVNWWFARSESRMLRQELRMTQAALKETQLRVEKDQLIIRQQFEMLRAAQQPAPQSSP